MARVFRFITAKPNIAEKFNLLNIQNRVNIGNIGRVDRKWLQRLLGRLNQKDNILAVRYIGKDAILEKRQRQRFDAYLSNRRSIRGKI